MNRSDKGTVVGNGTLWHPRLKRGTVSHEVAYQGHPVTGGMIAREYLHALLEASGRKRIGWDSRSFPMMLKTPPQFVIPCSADFISWDIKAAFWTIYSHLCIDFQYWGEHWGTGTVPFSLLPAWWGAEKSIRNTAIGCMRARSITVWDGSQMVQRSFYNKLLAPMIWGFICDLLNELAMRAYRSGAVYFNVDGGIWKADDYEKSQAWAAMLQDLGFEVVPQFAGEGEILSGGNWRIGTDRRGIGTVKKASMRAYDCPRAVEIWKLNRLELRSSGCAPAPSER